MSLKARGIVAGAVALVVEGILLLNVVWPFGASVDDQPQWMWVIGLMSFPVAGGLLMAYRPDNGVSITLGVSGVSAGVLFLLSWYGWEFRDAPLSRELEALEKFPSVAQTASIFALLHLFPNGRFSSRWFARIFWLQVAGFVIGAMLWFLGPSPLVVTERENPFALFPESWAPIADGTFVLVAPFALTGIVSLIMRRRQAGPIERAQFKWFFAAAVFSVAIFLPVFFLPGGDDAGEWGNLGVGLLVIAAFWALPAAIVIAVLRYRLYDIDILINRALVYGSLSAMTVALYAGLVVGLGWAVRTVAGQDGNEVVVAATTLIVAALFQPARRRIKAAVDRRFYRSRYDAARTIEAFQAQLRDQSEMHVLREELLRAVESALRPDRVGLWLRADATGRAER